MTDLHMTLDEVADLYDQARPAYPPEMTDAVNAVLHGTQGRILEVGCGTGQATLPFARQGYNMPMLLPPAFNSQDEPVKFMGRIKARAAKDFRWTTKRSLEDAMYLAYWSYVFGRNDDALQVCEFLSQLQFSGDYNLWTWIELSLALEARLLRISNKQQESAECVARIWDAGFVQERLEGLLLNGKERKIAYAVSDCDKVRERDWRAIMMLELCIIRELGGSEQLPVYRLEDSFQENLSRLQELVGAPG